MIIPSGPDNLPLRRFPIVSIGIMGGCLFFYLLYLIIPLPSMRPLNEAVSYRATHPYLEAPERLDSIVEARNERIARRGPPSNETRLRQEQEKMDSLAEAGLDAVDSYPQVRFGFRPARFSLFTLFAHIFFHHSAWLYLGTFFFFYITGPYLEDRWGRPFFAAFFVAGGVVGALSLFFIYPDSFAPLYGAGSAVAAVIGAYMVRFHDSRIKFVYLIKILREETYASPLVFFPMWFVAQLIISFSLSSSIGLPYIGYWAQISGLLFGAAVALVIRYRNLEPMLYQSPFEKLPEQTRFSISIPEKLQNGDTEGAFTQMAEAWRKYPENKDFAIWYWDQAVRLERTAGATGAARSVITNDIEAGDYDRAFYHWRELSKRHAGENIPPRQVEALAHGLMSVGQNLDARELLHYTFDHLVQGVTEEVVLNLLDAARFADPRLAVKVIDQLLYEGFFQGETIEQVGAMRQDILMFHPAAQNPEEEPEEEEVQAIEVARVDYHHIDPGDDPFIPTRIQRLKPYEAVPGRVVDEGIVVKLMGQQQARTLRWDQIKGVAVVAIRPIGDAPHLLIDLHTDNPMEEKEQHSFLRLSSRQFDPLTLLPGYDSPSKAVRALLKKILARGEVQPLPDAESLSGRFLNYPSVDSYELEVYGVTSR